VAFGDEGNDLLIGGGYSMDYLYGMEGHDIAAGDCVNVQFYQDSNLLASITSINTAVGKADVLTMGGGNDIAIGGMGGDIISGEDGMDLLFGDSVVLHFHNTPSMGIDSLWGAPVDMNSISCQDSGKDFIYGGKGEVDYIIAGGDDDHVEGELTSVK